ncbi:hypothetical protein O9992_19360 [Vibrio lentus]|nr:hypothetical protein [Vibrio lentus]
MVSGKQINPGNIKDKWYTVKGRTGNDGRFITFDKPENGIRAIARIPTLLQLSRYQHT